jgi:hypothetical protein
VRQVGRPDEQHVDAVDGRDGVGLRVLRSATVPGDLPLSGVFRGKQAIFDGFLSVHGDDFKGPEEVGCFSALFSEPRTFASGITCVAARVLP